eukprot:10524-Pleurochrysis_carterae.AAC.3
MAMAMAMARAVTGVGPTAALATALTPVSAAVEVPASFCFFACRCRTHGSRAPSRRTADSSFAAARAVRSPSSCFLFQMEAAQMRRQSTRTMRQAETQSAAVASRRLNQARAEEKSNTTGKNGLFATCFLGLLEACLV